MTTLAGLFRSERAAAALLLAAAVLGLVLANTGVGPALQALQSAVLGPTTFDLDLTVGEWVGDGLLAVFFFVVAVELRHELTSGELSSWHRALRPAIAAACGVAVPAGVYLVIAAGSGFGAGWPVPTATDIAFSLGVLAVFGRGLPSRIRVFLLALAVIDDLIAIVIIAVFFTRDAVPVDLVFAVVAIAVFGMLSTLLARRTLTPWARGTVGAGMVLVGVLTWMLVHGSGVNATIAGVALGLVMSRGPARRAAHALEPWTNGVILPLFAFSAALVTIPNVPPSRLSAPFWAILVALPVGKLLGITVGGWLGAHVGPRAERHPFDPQDVLVVATLGGVGFTISLLMNQLAFASDPVVRDQGTLAVLLGSCVALVASAFAVRMRVRAYRRIG